MAFETHFNTIRSRFKTEVATAHSITTLYENAPTAKPNDALYIELVIIILNRSIVSFGSTKTYRAEGEMIAKVYGKLDNGDKDILAACDDVMDSFTTVTASSVRFQTPYIEHIGRDGGYYQKNVHCPFYIDDNV